MRFRDDAKLDTSQVEDRRREHAPPHVDGGRTYGRPTPEQRLFEIARRMSPGTVGGSVRSAAPVQRPSSVRTYKATPADPAFSTLTDVDWTTFTDYEVPALQGGSLVGFPIGRRLGYLLASNKTISNNTATMIPWDSLEQDKGMLGTFTVGNTTATPVLPNYMYVLYVAEVLWVSNGTGRRDIQIASNTASFFSQPQTAPGISGSGLDGSSVQGQVMSHVDGVLTAGLAVKQNSGGNLDITTATLSFVALGLDQ